MLLAARSNLLAIGITRVALLLSDVAWGAMVSGCFKTHSNWDIMLWFFPVADPLANSGDRDSSSSCQGLQTPCKNARTQPAIYNAVPNS